MPYPFTTICVKIEIEGFRNVGSFCYYKPEESYPVYFVAKFSKPSKDFGIWNKLNSNQLSCPLDIHTGNIARKLGLLNRKINDLKALKELDEVLRSFDASDPVKYDFALFGLWIENEL